MENEVDVIDVTNLDNPGNLGAKAYIDSLPKSAENARSSVNLTAALAKAQANFKPVQKKHVADAGKYSYNYADLADVLEMCRPVLAKEGIALTQPLRFKGGKLRVTTRIELNGQMRESDGIAINEGLLPQEFGATLTYWRRYDLTSFLGISTEEDVDMQKARRAAGKSAGTEKFQKREEIDNRLQDRIKPYQVNAFNSACNQSNRTKPEIAAFLKNLKHVGPEELTKGEFDMAIKWALAPQKQPSGTVSNCYTHGDYAGDGNCPTCELGITERDTATVK